MLSLTQALLLFIVAILIAISGNVIQQVLFSAQSEPPVVFHWVPFIGSMIAYNNDPYKFLSTCRERYGNVFSFVLWGRKTTVFLDARNTDSVAVEKEPKLSSEGTCGPLCNSVPNTVADEGYHDSTTVEQKNSKHALMQDLMASHVQVIEKEVLDYVNKNASCSLRGNAGTLNVPDAMAQINIILTGQAFRNDEVRDKLTTELTDFYYDLEKGFSPLRLVLPWFSLLHNQDRATSQAKMQAAYMDIIQQKRFEKDLHKTDMFSNLMRCVDRSGEGISDEDVAHVMTSFMENQYLLNSISAWILLHLANAPEITEKLYQEQLEKLSLDHKGDVENVRYTDLEKLTLHWNVVRETLRMYKSIHSSVREVNSQTSIPGTNYTIPAGRLVLASSDVLTNSLEHSPDPGIWQPDRWESNTAEQEHDSVMVNHGDEKSSTAIARPFFLGPNDCIGEKLVHINLMVITAILVRTFKFWNLAGVKGVRLPDYSGVVPCPSQPAIVKWERRGGGEKAR